MFTIIENQTKPDGTINTETTARQTRNSALSYFHERLGKMYMTELFTSVVVAVYDENLNQLDRRIVETMYKPPVEEPVPEPIEEPTEEVVE